ncbi:MAG: exopolysaccharide Pel transporter PelG [Bdellovibrio sp.]
MAGIGFRLRNYFKPDDLLGKVKGTIYSIIISSGPWLITVLTVASVSIYAQRQLSMTDLFILKSIITYTFAASLIIFGAIEMPLTRYLSDKIYISDYSTFSNVFLSLLIIVTIIGAVLGSLFYSYFEFNLLVRSLGVTFFVSVLLVWLSMIFLSAAKNFHQISISFFLGGVFSFAMSLTLGKFFDLPGFLGGFALGQSLTACLLTRNLMSEFPDRQYISFEYFEYFYKNRRMIFIGLFYYIGIWMDKFVFWFMGEGKHVTGLLYTNLYYDTAIFLAYLTVVPSFAIFMVQVETNFYVKYSYYFRTIENRYDLKMIETGKNEIVGSLRHALNRLLRIQFFITILAWVFAEPLFKFMALPSMMIPIFRYGSIAAFLQVLFLILNIIHLYFKDTKPVLINYGFFMISNFVLSWISIVLDFRFWGLGYLISTFLTLILSFYTLNRTLIDLNLFTFMRQPLTQRNYSEEF